MKSLFKQLSMALLLVVSIAGVNTASAKTLQLALVLDGSGSISPSQYQLQLDGYKNILTSATFYQDYILASPYDTVIVDVYQFAGSVIAEVSNHIISDQASGVALGNMFTTAIMGQLTGLTNTYQAITDAVAGFNLNGDDMLIDISTDGVPTTDGGIAGTSSANALAAAAAARAAGITVNALGVGSGIDGTFLGALVDQGGGGPNSGFYLQAPTFAQFQSTLEAKFGREITGIPEPTMLLLMALALVLLIKRNRKTTTNSLNRQTTAMA